MTLERATACFRQVYHCAWSLTDEALANAGVAGCLEDRQSIRDRFAAPSAFDTPDDNLPPQINATGRGRSFVRDW
jgi:hypothetical protein